MRAIITGCLVALAVSVGLASAQEADRAGEPRENPMITIKTSKGDVQVELFEQEAPETVANFLQYVDDGFFSGTIFHRVIPGFMVQGGGLDQDLRQKETRAPVRNEAANGLKNERGTLAMARTQVVDSATSQFFINLVDNDFLNHTRPDPRGFGYCVFGRVVEGLDVVDAIAQVRTASKGPHETVPVEPVEILEVVRD